MSEWTVSLVYTDAKSNKFWRARIEGSQMCVNYGRVGTDGATQFKDFGSAAEAAAALDKQADGKRKKGYADDGGAGAGGAAPAEPTEPNAPGAPIGPRSVTLERTTGGRKVKVVLSVDGATLRTEVSETYGADADAADAFARIERAMAAEGYRAK